MVMPYNVKILRVNEEGETIDCGESISKNIMEYEENRQELINALKVIKNVCAQYIECSGCPLSCARTNECQLQIDPDTWEFNGIYNDWKAIKDIY